LGFPKQKLDTLGGRVHVEWDPQAAVTPLGQLPFFIDFLKTSELFERWVADCPVVYTSPNAPRKVDVLGTLFLSTLSGHWRYAHIEGVRNDTVNAPLLGMSKVVSSSAARRAFLTADAQACDAWLQEHLSRCSRELFWLPWILDIDTHVCVLYGHQEGAVVGYNPKKPGRPSRVLHTYFMANTRLVLDVETHPGNQTAASYTMPGLWAYLDRLERRQWPMFIRGDCAYGVESAMVEAERRELKYLFKLRQTAKVKRMIEQSFARRDWVPAGQGWEGVEDRLRLTGWTSKRRVVVLRRPVTPKTEEKPAPVALPEERQLLLKGVDGRSLLYEYAVLVTNLPDEILTLAQHYRDRGDAENIYDETVNQWAWGGYTTQDLKRSAIMVRIVALTYNWWSLYVRLAIPERHAEAITSRPLLLHGVAKQTIHAGQKTITITCLHAQGPVYQQVLKRMAAFLEGIRTIARQLTWEQRWRLILSKVFEYMLRGRPLGPPGLLPAPT
jgi:hypothetical protein